MEVSSNFIKHNMDEEILLIPIGNSSLHGIIRLNSTAEFIYDCLSKGMDRKSIMDSLSDKYIGNQKDFVESVDFTISELEKNGVLKK